MNTLSRPYRDPISISLISVQFIMNFPSIAYSFPTHSWSVPHQFAIKPYTFLSISYLFPICSPAIPYQFYHNPESIPYRSFVASYQFGIKPIYQFLTDSPANLYHFHIHSQSITYQIRISCLTSLQKITINSSQNPYPFSWGSLSILIRFLTIPHWFRINPPHRLPIKFLSILYQSLVHSLPIPYQSCIGPISIHRFRVFSISIPNQLLINSGSVA